MITKTLFQNRLFRTGLICQAISALIVVTLIVSVKAGWLDLPSPDPGQAAPPVTPVDALFVLALLSFATGFTLQVIAVAKLPKPTA